MRGALLVIALMLSFCAPTAIIAQEEQKQGAVANAQEMISGHYEGIAKSKKHGSIPLSIELIETNGTLAGLIKTPIGDAPINGGSYTNGKLRIDFESDGDPGSIIIELQTGAGTFTLFDDDGPIQLKRTGATDYKPPVALQQDLSISKEAWREDLQYLAAELPRRHANAFHAITREQFASAVADLDARIPKLQPNEIVVGLTRLTAMIGDGHTHLQWPRAYGFVPLRLFWFGNELRVIQTTEKYRSALGTKLVKIGETNINDAYAKDLPYISQEESEGFLRSASAWDLICPAQLQALGLVPETTHALYTFEDDKGHRFSLDLPAMSRDEKATWIYPAKQLPLYLQKPDVPLWFTYMADAQTVYFNFRGYPSRTEFRKFANEFFAFLDGHPVERLIVDMRNNGGGDFTKGRDFIIGEIIKRDQINRRGRLYVLIGRVTYSAGMTNSTDFRKDTKAILVGEPTGARPNGYQENRYFKLPNSHLDVSVSTQLYKFQEKDTPGVMPDKLITPDWAAYKIGRDPVLEWILAQSIVK